MRWLAVLILVGCGTTWPDIREGYIRDNPDTEYAHEIRQGQIVVGMTEADAIHTESIGIVRTWEDGDGWARYYAGFGPQWSTRLAVYIRNGYVTSVMR